MILFSSSTARLGRKGQGAYCLANEILNRAASFLSHRYDCRALALNWGPWDGGMVSGLTPTQKRQLLTRVASHPHLDQAIRRLRQPALREAWDEAVRGAESSARDPRTIPPESR